MIAGVTPRGPCVALSPCMRIAIALLAVGACGGANGIRPHDMTAAEHMQAARDHGEAASRTRDRAVVLGTPYHTGPRYYWGHPYWGQGYYPWYYYWDPRLDHLRLAEAHQTAADSLRAEYEAACVTVPTASQALSPLDVYALSSDRLDDGVVVHVARDAGPPEALLAGMRCHRAWLRLEPRPQAKDSLVTVDGATVVVHAARDGDGIEVMFSIKDDAGRSELVRRAQLTVLRARQRQGGKD